MVEAIEALVLERVGHQFSGELVLRGLCGRFDPGHLHLVVGPNGCGKTTLLRMMSTLLVPSYGRVVYEGGGRRVVVGEDGGAGWVRGRVGYAPTGSSLYADLTGFENLMLGAEIHGVGVEAVRRVSSRVGVDGLLGRCVRTMSRGQRQRLGIARALVHGPSLVLLDEPTACLDLGAVELLVSLVGDLVLGGVVVVVATHDPGVFGGVPVRLWRLLGGGLGFGG